MICGAGLSRQIFFQEDSVHTRNKARTFALIVICILSLSCSTVPGLLATPTPAPTGTPTVTFTPTITLTPTVTLTPTPFYEVEAGSEVKLPAGGFSLNRIKGYDFIVNTASLSIFSDDDNDLNAHLFAYNDKSPLTIKGIANRYTEYLVDNFDEFQASEPVIEIQGDVEKATVDFSGFEDDEPARGRLTIFLPSDSKLVYFIIVAVGDQRWEREGEKVYNAIASSISFFPIAIKEGCPIHKNPGYGASPAVPIRIGGGLRLGDQRVDNYLDALLGPNGELVAYFRTGTEEVNGVSYERYRLEFGRQSKTLYFDIYSSSDLSVPTGMTCSAALPQKTGQ